MSEYKLIYVKWIDSFAGNGTWSDMQTSVYHEDLGTSLSCCGDMSIPKCAILESRYVK